MHTCMTLHYMNYITLYCIALHYITVHDPKSSGESPNKKKRILRICNDHYIPICPEWSA